jgi:hypothetical protein
MAHEAVDQQAGMVELDAAITPLLEQFQVAPAIEDVLVGVQDQLVAMADQGAHRFAVGLPGEVQHDVLEVLAQGTEQHVQLGGAGLLQRLVVGGVGENAQAAFVAGEGAVDQRGVEPAQMAQGIAEVERRLQPQQRQAVATGQAEVEQQGLLAAVLHHPRQVGGQQRTVGPRWAP